jgi:hypothetical protein
MDAIFVKDCMAPVTSETRLRASHIFQESDACTERMKMLVTSFKLQVFIYQMRFALTLHEPPFKSLYWAFNHPGNLPET